MREAMVDDLIQAGLLADLAEPRLTGKGRDWLRVLEDALVETPSTAQSDEDFVQSTSGIFR